MVESILPSKETPLSQYISTRLSEEFSDCHGPNASHMDMRRVFNEESHVSRPFPSLEDESMLTFEESLRFLDDTVGAGGNVTACNTFLNDKSMGLPDESQTSDNCEEDLLAAVRKLSLWSGGDVIYAEPIGRKEPFNVKQRIFMCSYCQTSYFGWQFTPLKFFSLDCSKHGGDDYCRSESDTEKFRENILRQVFESECQYLQYQCFICESEFCDLRDFKCHLKCHHSLNDVILCESCITIFFNRF